MLLSHGAVQELPSSNTIREPLDQILSRERVRRYLNTNRPSHQSSHLSSPSSELPTRHPPPHTSTTNPTSLTPHPHHNLPSFYPPHHQPKMSAYTTPSARWRAIVNRDASATNFVYGVRTTKIYCRPRCPARLARRANVIFYDTPAQAEKAGYRPCKRCKPEDLLAPMDPHIKLAQKACETMALAALAGGKQKPTLNDLASEAGLTPSHFHRVFKKVVGITPGKFARDAMEGKMALKRLEDGTISFGLDKGPLALNAKVLGGVGGGGAAVAAVAAAQVVDTQRRQPHPADPIPIDWNEFDRLMVADQPSTSSKVYTGNADSSGFYIPTEDMFNTYPALDNSPILLGQSQYGFSSGNPNDILDISLNASRPNYLGDDSIDYSLPSSETSSTPVDTPPFVDSFASLAPSPLLFDDVGWFEECMPPFQSYT